MPIEIVLKPSYKKRLEEEFGEDVVRRLNKEINKMNDMLRWKSHVEECFPKFRAVDEYAGNYFAEIGFDAKQRSHRAIVAWIEEQSIFVVACVFEKEQHYQSSKQSKIFNQIDKNGSQVMQDIYNRYDF